MKAKKPHKVLRTALRRMIRFGHVKGSLMEWKRKPGREDDDGKSGMSIAGVCMLGSVDNSPPAIPYIHQSMIELGWLRDTHAFCKPETMSRCIININDGNSAFGQHEAELTLKHALGNAEEVVFGVEAPLEVD